MANPEHLKLLREGTRAINEWRASHPEGFDLRGANVQGCTAEEADFRGAQLNDATLTGLNLNRGNFDGADLSGATISGGQINNSTFRGANLTGARLISVSAVDGPI